MACWLPCTGGRPLPNGGGTARKMIENTAALLAVGTIFAVGFLILTLPLGLLFGWLGKRWAVAR